MVSSCRSLFPLEYQERLLVNWLKQYYNFVVRTTLLKWDWIRASTQKNNAQKETLGTHPRYKRIRFLRYFRFRLCREILGGQWLYGFLKFVTPLECRCHNMFWFESFNDVVLRWNFTRRANPLVRGVSNVNATGRIKNPFRYKHLRTFGFVYVISKCSFH